MTLASRVLVPAATAPSTAPAPPKSPPSAPPTPPVLPSLKMISGDMP
jgi:hypothetical protein